MTDETQNQNANDGVRITDSRGRPLSKSRRNFLTNAGMFSAGLVGSTLLAACSDDRDVALAQNDDNGNAAQDQAVLNFALNLEYLEAEYYLLAVAGRNLSDDDTGGTGMSGMVTGGSQVNFSMGNDQLIGRYAAEIASDELDHVQALRAALGGAAVARPQINLETSFTAAARAALMGAGINPPDDFTFNPFASPLAFLIGAFIFEDVGVSAYKGGAALISNPEFLTAAAGILSVEGYHAGLVRTLLTQRQDETALTVNGQDLTVGQVVNAISDARDSLDGCDDLDQGIVDTDFNTVSIYGESYASTNIVPVDSRGITFSRSPQQVHNIVYLTPMAVGPEQGSVPDAAFFPNGTNGTFTMSGDQTGGCDASMDNGGMGDDSMGG